jgi:hypothetical protein
MEKKKEQESCSCMEAFAVQVHPTRKMPANKKEQKHPGSAEIIMGDWFIVEQSRMTDYPLPRREAPATKNVCDFPPHAESTPVKWSNQKAKFSFPLVFGSIGSSRCSLRGLQYHGWDNPWASSGRSEGP